MTKLKHVGTWVHGLISAFIGGAVTAVADIGSDLILEGSVTLNVKKLGLKALVGGGLLAIAYLKQSPLPPIEEVETAFFTKPKE
jgi:hypothetical protein